MSAHLDFENIRPYNDSEIPPAMERLIRHPTVFKLMKYLFPTLSKTQLIERALSVKTVKDLQNKFSLPALTNIAKFTTDGLTCEGFEYLVEGEGHVFISNHRDILLDSAFLNILLMGQNMDTVETGTGDNLLISEFITDLMRANRSFTVHRNVSKREMYHFSLRLSAYIRKRVVQDHVSIWIAQRNGRTKDGHDQTETGLLKMLGLSNEDFLQGFADLSIIPMATSYQYDPCDSLKAQERYLSLYDKPYKKSRKDDLKSMLAGVTDYKGKVHLALGRPIRLELEGLATIPNRNERIRAFTKIFDRHIYDLYKLWPQHYIAADLKSGEDTYSNHYTSEEVKSFEEYIQERLKDRKGDPGLLRQLMLDIYANPVKDKLETVSGA